MFQKVLVPLDGSELSERALNYLRDLVHEGSASEATLITVVGMPTPWDANAAVNVYDNTDVLFDEATEYLTKLANELTAEGIPTQAEVLGGIAASTIVDYAREIGADLIIMATHGYSGFKRLVLGSVAQRVLQEAPCPVLLIRANPEEE